MFERSSRLWSSLCYYKKILCLYVFIYDMNFGLTEFFPFHLCWNMCIHWKLFWMWKNLLLVYLLLHEMEIENAVCIDISFQEFIISIFMIYVPGIVKSWNAIMSEYFCLPMENTFSEVAYRLTLISIVWKIYFQLFPIRIEWQSY